MRSRRRPPTAAAKCALLAGAAVAVLATSAAAQPKPPRPPRPTIVRPTPVPDNLKPGEAYMEADEVIRDDEHKTTTAQGSVEMRYEGRTLRADKVIYEEGKEPGQGVIRAIGHVQIINADGTVEFADQFVLDDKMRAGVAQGFSARAPVRDPQPGEIKLAAATAVRRSDTIQELNRAIYTPCPICAGDHPRTPSWSISAERVVQDKQRRIVVYRNARIRIFGVPVIYLPVFWHADPSADRASGLLAPKIQASDRRGFSYEQPYLWTLSPYADLILSPQINTKVNPFLNGAFRERFYSGDIEARFGYTHDKDFDGSGNKFGEDTNRSYILARGGFQLNDYWRWGFTAERTSDPLLFDKYQIGDVYQTRGPYIADDHRLISQIYAARQDSTSYFSAAAFSIQGLRVGDNNRTFPVVAPLIESHFEIPQEIAGGRLRINASAVALTRDQSPDQQALNLPGLDSRRATGELDWRTSFTSSGGLRVEPFLQARADAYSLDDVLTGNGRQTRSETVTRALGVVGADITYPLYRRLRDATVVLEPVAQIAISPDAKQVEVGRDAAGNPIYLNEDSIAFEFDETTLFRANKFPGFDLYEDGVRLNLGGRAAVLWDDGRRANLLIGRSFRTERNTVFSPSSGLRDQSSDWIIAGDAQPVKGLSLFARARLDGDTLDAHRLEGGVNVYNKWGSGYVRYLKDDQGINGVPIENLDVGGDIRVTQNWGFTLYGNRDLIQNAWVIRDVGVYYRDDCARVDVIYRREDTVQGRLGPTDSIALRLTLATLGSPFTVR
jgi:LPS-assembly protein